jgi:lysophospholipase-3
LPSATGTYKVILDKLVSAGYKPGQDLFGAPYDFRLAADGLMQVGWFARLQQLVEQAVQQNNNRPAVFVAHSMGCLVSLYFLTRQSPDWRSKNVAGLVAISAPWEGSVTALKGSISGDNFDVSGVPHDLLRPVQSTAPSAPWLFPTPDVWGDKVLVRTKSAEYTGRDIPRLLLDLFLEQQAAVYHVTRNLTYPLPPLDMPVYCLHGTGVDTDESFYYDVDRFNHDAPPAPKNITKGDGDGTVPLVSLEACSKLGAQAVIKTYDGAEHTGILGDDRMVADLLGILHSKGATGNWLQRYVRGVIGNLQGLWSSDTSYKAQRRLLAA